MSIQELSAISLAIIPRADHNISRAHISENALKVLYRLKDAGYEAYLVGGGVRDLLLGREPKDFDVATNAAPEEVDAAVPQLPAHRPALPPGPCALRRRDHRGRHFRRQPGRSAYRGGRGARIAHDGSGRILRDNITARWSRTRCGATSASTPSTTISATSRSRITWMGLRICVPASCGSSATRKPATAKTRCACCGRCASR